MSMMYLVSSTAVIWVVKQRWREKRCVTAKTTAAKKALFFIVIIFAVTIRLTEYTVQFLMIDQQNVKR